MTVSEQRFEEYCANRGYRFTRIELPTSAGRRPDYRLHLPAGDTICEVKQIESGAWEKEVDERLAKHGRSDFSRSIGTRARALIANAAPQLRNFKSENRPCIIVAMDLTWHDHLSYYDLDAAMFGQPLVRFYLNGKPDDDPRSEFGHGGSRQMTEDSRIYVSALCVLHKQDLKVTIYHNPFAAQPLYPYFFPHEDDRHFFKDGHPETAGHLWMEYTGPRTKPA